MPCLGTVLGLELLLFLDFSGAEREDQARTEAMVLVVFFCSQDGAEGQIKFYGKRKNHRESMFLADLMPKLLAEFRHGRFFNFVRI